MLLTTNSVLLWDSKASTLILAMLREQPIDFSIVIPFRPWYTKDQRRYFDNLIKEWNLKCFVYPPSAINFIAKDSAVFQYGINGQQVPIVRQFTGGKCSLTELDGNGMAHSPIKWDLVIWDKDTRPGFYNPLENWTQSEIDNELEKRGIETGLTDIQLCTACLDTDKDTVFCPKDKIDIPTVRWDASANLKLFQESYA